MDAKGACHKAKDYIADLFADEGVTNIGLEEVEFESTSNSWRITISFSRPWDHKNPLTAKHRRLRGYSATEALRP